MAAVAAVAMMSVPTTGWAGPIAERAAEAEARLSAGDGAAALEAFEQATALFWRESPLQIPVVALADSVAGFADFVSRESAAFRSGDTLRVYVEPFGQTFIPEEDGFRSALAVDVAIRAPGGLILAEAEDFGLLTWSARDMTYETHATIAVPLPELKPGPYELVMTFRDQASTKAATATVPFSIDR